MEDDDNVVAASEAIVEQQTEAAIAEIRATLQGEGAKDCIDCGDEIEAARREAMPSAVRCVRCQDQYERRGKH